jgi:hypothetical protein
MNTRLQIGFGRRRLTPPATQINRLYLHRILKKTSYELFTGKKPNVSYFRVLGANALFLLREVEILNLLLRL